MHEIPKLAWDDKEYMFVDSTGFEVTFSEVVERYNDLASKLERVLVEIEELVHDTRAIPPHIPAIHVYTGPLGKTTTIHPSSPSPS